MTDFRKIPLGAKLSPEDNRDYHVSQLIQKITRKLPDEYELPYDFEVKNQGNINSCVAFASVQWRECLRRQAGLDWIEPSYMAQYYQARLLDQSQLQDNGTTVENNIQVLETLGIMAESNDTYDGSNLYVDPDDTKFITSLKLNINQVKKIDNYNTVTGMFDGEKALADIIDAVINEHPVLLAMSVYSEFVSSETIDTGILQAPSSISKFLGGHGIICVGVDNVNQRLLCLNQYGKDWGIKNPIDFQGCFWMSYDYIRQCLTWSMYVGFPDVVATIPKYWRVQCSAFSTRERAEAYKQTLLSKGINSYIVFVNGLYKNQCGAFSNEVNARNYSSQLKNSGIDNFIIYY